MMGMIRDIVARRELLAMLVVRNLKIRYKDSALGFFWTMLGPILMILVYAVFLRILRIPVAMPVLVTGIFVWQYLAMCLGDSPNAIIGSTNLVKKAAFPRLMLPLAITSTKKMIARLGGRRWNRLHNLVYVTCVLGIIHFWMAVKADIGDPLMFAAFFAVLFAYRIWKWRERTAGAATPT